MSMAQTAVGYARCGADEQHLAARRQALAALGLPLDRLGRPELSTAQHAHLTKVDAGHGPEISELAKAVLSPPTGRVPRRGRAANLMAGTTRLRIMGRDDSASTSGAGLAAEVACALLVVSALVPVAGALSLAADIRRGRERHRQDVLIGKLWAAVKRIPAGTVLDDPLTCCRVSAELDGGFLIVAIGDPLDHPDAEATVARYTLGYWAVQAWPPLYRHLAGIHDMSPARMRWQQGKRLAEFNAIISAPEVTAEDIAGLLDQVTRSLTARLR